MEKYNPQKIEKKWQIQWQKDKLYVAQDKVKSKGNFYYLVEFPYPSGNLHIGHWYTFAVPDIAVRYFRMKGKNVMYPIGFDAFGLPAENAAIKNNLQPEDWTSQNISHMTSQLKSMGAAFDWSRELKTIDPNYYKWTQWIFLQFYKKGLAYRAKTHVNWCPNDKTVLANEQVVDGSCDRCGTQVVQKEMNQWMYKITDYADKLIDDLEKVDWPEVTKTAQRNWIGRSRGAEIHFLLPNSKETIKVFTTRADTLYGATYVVLAPEHPLVTKLTKDTELNAVSKYLENAKNKSELERTSLEKEKTGVFTGAYAVNPINREEIPIWVSDYVLGWYGTGAVMAVPAHDGRDFEFAKKYKLSIKQVIKGEGYKPDEAYIEDGMLIDSGEFTGQSSEEGRKKIVEKLSEQKLGERKDNYKLHDWVLSRQRYWGTPIPMINCSKCGYRPVAEKDLPVELPRMEDYKPSEDGRSPLAKAKDWLTVKCPNCGDEAERETDTMDTFVDSSWYFLRYTDPKNKKAFADPEKIKSWLPVNMYYGGAEHNTMHLLYSRFFTKAMYDLGLLDFDEPFTIRRNHGVMLGSDSQKMSKSKGNVVDPDDLVEKYGADTVRMYLAFMGPYDQGGPWNPGGIVGVYRFLNRVWNFVGERKFGKNAEDVNVSKIVSTAIHKIEEDIKKTSFNTGVSELMKAMNFLEEVPKEVDISKDNIERFIKILAPFAPHLAEDIWHELLGHKKSIHIEDWPEYDADLLKEETVRLVVQVNGRARDVIDITAGLHENEAKEIALNSEKIKKYIGSQKVKKFIYIQNRLLNIVLE